MPFCMGIPILYNLNLPYLQDIMNRVTFIKMASAFVGAPLLAPYNSWTQPKKLQNWAGNLEYSTTNVHYPKSVTEVQNMVRKYNRLRTLGTRHCFNRIAD